MSIKINYINYLTILIKWVILVLLIIIAVFPVFWIISLSLRPNQETLGRNPTLLPIKWTLENYLNLFGIDVNTDRMQQLDFNALLNFIVNGAIVAVMVTFIACILSLLAGVFFPKIKYFIYFSGALIATSRVVVGAHYFTDIIGGIAISFIGFKFTLFVFK